jgi:hypothetical protein
MLREFSFGWDNWNMTTLQSKAVKLHTIEVLKGEDIWLFIILDLGTRWRWSGQRDAPDALYPRVKGRRKPADRRINHFVWSTNNILLFCSEKSL